MKKIVLLGSTGSIGTQTLEVVRNHKEEFNIAALACGYNIELFGKQLDEFMPAFAVCAKEEDAKALSSEYPKIEFGYGMEGLCSLAALSDGDIVVNALMGMMGIRPTLAALEAGKTLAFANKETLVTAGKLVTESVKRNAAALLPVDSEHSAIFQAIQGNSMNPVKKILLTASGGPFRKFSKEDIAKATKEQALKHPNWNMGAKITIDSASMMNKGLEVIEARWLFDVQPENIEVLVHPQSVLHSAVEFEDGCVLGQMGVPDMKAPIAYALSYPKRLSNVARSLDLFEIGKLEFEKPDLDKFRCLALAYKAIELGGSYTIAMNAANEYAVAAFLKDKISFGGIADMVEFAMDKHNNVEITDVEDILEVQRKTEEILCQAF